MNRYEIYREKTLYCNVFWYFFWCNFPRSIGAWKYMPRVADGVWAHFNAYVLLYYKLSQKQVCFCFPRYIFQTILSEWLGESEPRFQVPKAQLFRSAKITIFPSKHSATTHDSLQVVNADFVLLI